MKQATVDESSDHGIEMGDELYKCYCRVCESHLACIVKARNTKLRGKVVNDFRFNRYAISRHLALPMHTANASLSKLE